MNNNNIKGSPEFPGKIYFSNFKDQNIQMRKQKLEQYLNQVSALIPNLLEIAFVKEFLEIESHSVQTKVENPTRIHKRSQSIFIIEFLKKLNNKYIKIKKTIEDFEEIYFAAAPELSPTDISLLFMGEDTLKGLIYFCGNSENHSDNNMCITLLSKLISNVENTSCGTRCYNTFCAIKLTVIKSMNLGDTIAFFKSTNSSACNLIHQYIIGNTQANITIKDILDEKQHQEEYEKWLGEKSSLKQSKTEESDTIKQLMDKSLEDTKITKVLVESSNLSALNEMKELMNHCTSPMPSVLMHPHIIMNTGF